MKDNDSWYGGVYYRTTTVGKEVSMAQGFHWMGLCVLMALIVHVKRKKVKA